MQQLTIKINVSNSFDFGQLIISDHSIEFLYKNVKICKSSKDDVLFVILKDLRAELENFEIFLLINGSRVDAYVRGVMAFSHYVLLLKQGVKMEESLKVNMFDEVQDINMVSSVNAQKEYYEKWKESVFG